MLSGRSTDAKTSAAARHSSTVTVTQGKVCKKRIKDIDELRALILTAWDEMDQRIIDAAITCLHACIKAKGGQCEHTLSQ